MGDLGASSRTRQPLVRSDGERPEGLRPGAAEGESQDLYVIDGRVTYERQPGAETAAEGWIVPGLVDAHCHLGLDDDGATDDADTEQQAVDDRDGGALLIRDAGSAPTPAGCTSVTTCPA